MGDQTLLSSIFEKIVKLSKARKVDWEPLGESSFRVSFGDYWVRLTKHAFIVLDMEDNLLDEHDQRLFLPSERLDVSELHELARRHTLKVDEKLDQLNKLLDKVGGQENDDLPF